MCCGDGSDAVRVSRCLLFTIGRKKRTKKSLPPTFSPLPHVSYNHESLLQRRDTSRQEHTPTLRISLSRDVTRVSLVWDKIIWTQEKRPPDLSPADLAENFLTGCTSKRAQPIRVALHAVKRISLSHGLSRTKEHGTTETTMTKNHRRKRGKSCADPAKFLN